MHELLDVGARPGQHVQLEPVRRQPLGLERADDLGPRHGRAPVKHLRSGISRSSIGSPIHPFVH